MTISKVNGISANTALKILGAARAKILSVALTAAGGGASTISAHSTLNDAKYSFPMDSTGYEEEIAGLATSNAGGTYESSDDSYQMSDITIYSTDSQINTDFTGAPGITIAFQILYNDTTAEPVLIGPGVGAEGSTGIMIRSTSAGRFQTWYTDSSISHNQTLISGQAPTNTWLHCIMSVGDGFVKFWVNGTKVIDNTSVGTPSIASGAISTITFGNDATSNDRLRNAVIWNRGITDSEASDLWNSGTPLEWS